MRTIILALLLNAALFIPAQAQDNALLYEVSGKGLSTPSYLYGTFHLVCPSDLVVKDSVRKALASSKQLYLELDFDDPALQTNMLKGMMLSDGKTLKDFLKPEDYSALDTYMQRNLGAGLAKMGFLKPIALLSVIYASLLKCQPASYDLTFAQMAGQEGKEVLGLETFEQQMSLIDRVPIEQQLKGLVDIARMPEEAQKEFTELLEAYKSQDVGLMMKLVRESKFDDEIKGFEEELLDKRNVAWIPLIEKVAREKPTFFAFGAGHLGGTNGVINLLRQRGYAVKPLP